MCMPSATMAGQVNKINGMKAIICVATAKYNEEDPNSKFPAGSRSDVKPVAGAFLLSEYDLNENGDIQEYGNQQFYFSDDGAGEISFEFIAPWKANGSSS